MKIKLLYLYIISIMALCNACKDKDPTKPGYQRKPPAPEFYRFTLGEAKNYLWAKPGSYWIYKNTKTGDLDTQVVTSFYFDSTISKGSYDYSKHITIKYDKLQRTIFSSYNNWNYYDETSGYNANATPLKGLFYALEHAADGSYISSFHFPFNNAQKSGTGSEITTFVGIDSILVLQGTTYMNVVKYDIDFDAIKEKDCQYTPTTIYYWAKDIGLIKKDIKNCNYSWELIEYNIKS